MLKDQGNKAFAAKDWDSAIDLFSQAIAIDPKNHVLWSNRSAAKAGKKDWTGALADADEVRQTRASCHPEVSLTQILRTVYSSEPVVG